jgi:hypothetical protein
MLSAAAQRDDRCLVAPRNLKGGAAQRVAAKLIDGGLAKEIKAKPGAPVWRRDEQERLKRSTLSRALQPSTPISFVFNGAIIWAGWFPPICRAGFS